MCIRDSTFFAREECYEVIWLPEGKELLVSHALSLQLRPPDNYQRLIVLSSETQLELAGRLPDVTAYCLPRNGKIHYYKKGLTYGPVSYTHLRFISALRVKTLN